MKEELLKRLQAFHDAVKKNGSTTEAAKFLDGATDAVRNGGALKNTDDEFQDKLFDLITEIDSLDDMSDANREKFNATVELIEDTLYENEGE